MLRCCQLGNSKRYVCERNHLKPGGGEESAAKRGALLWCPRSGELRTRYPHQVSAPGIRTGYRRRVEVSVSPRCCRALWLATGLFVGEMG